MFRKDDKGYVMSGLGFLLIIPVIIIIPMALSIQEQSADIPNTYVKSDTVFQTLKNTQNDINDKTNNYTNKINKKIYDNPLIFAQDIYSLYNGTNENIYKSTFNGSVDSFSISQNLGLSTLNLGNESGVIPLKNGIQLKYNYTGQETINSKIFYAFSMNVVVNMNFNIAKNNTGNNQNFYTDYTPVTFYLDSSKTNPNTFFVNSNLGSTLTGYNIIKN